MTGNVPSRIALTVRANMTMTTEARASADGAETGGILLGSTHPDEVIVRHAGQPGPRAIRQPRFFLRDLAHAQHLADEAFDADGSVWVGEWHTHVGIPAVPSARDLATYEGFLADHELGFDYFIAIIVDAPTDWLIPRIVGWIIAPSTTERVPISVAADEPPSSLKRTVDGI